MNKCFLPFYIQYFSHGDENYANLKLDRKFLRYKFFSSILYVKIIKVVQCELNKHSYFYFSHFLSPSYNIY